MTSIHKWSAADQKIISSNLLGPRVDSSSSHPSNLKPNLLRRRSLYTSVLVHFPTDATSRLQLPERCHATRAGVRSQNWCYNSCGQRLEAMDEGLQEEVRNQHFRCSLQPSCVGYRWIGPLRLRNWHARDFQSNAVDPFHL
jgi:hypothetical protein